MAVPTVPVTDDAADEPTIDPRDDFSTTTKVELLVRAGNMCSRCKAITVASTYSGNRKNSIGVAAHICAAAKGPGAKRYDPDQSKAERKHYDNGIWMCYSCSKLIDNEEILHTVAYLKEMKAGHEVYASTWVGVVPIAPFEFANKLQTAIIEATIQLMTKQGIPTDFDISAVVKGYEQSINSLDPNFKVVVTSTSKHVQHNIIPVGTAIPDVKMVFQPEDYNGFIKAWKAMAETGDEIQLTTDEFKFKGSPLFEHLNQSASKMQLTIARSKQKCDATVYLVDGTERFELGSGEALVTDGTKKFGVEGSLFDGFFTYKYSGIVDGAMETSYCYHQSAWLGQPFNNIKGYYKLKKAYDFLTLHPNAEFDVEVHAFGSTLSMWRTSHKNYSVFHERFRFIIELTEILISLSRKMNKILLFKSLEILEQDIDMLVNCALVFDGPVTYKIAAGTSILNAPVIDDDACKINTSQRKVTDQPIHMTLAPLLNLYGNWISFPQLTRIFSTYDVTYVSHQNDDETETTLCVISANDETEFFSYLDPDGEYSLQDESDNKVIEAAV